MPIQINITGEHATEALTELATLAAGLSGQSAAAPQITATAAPETPKQTRSRNTSKPVTPKEPDSETPAEPESAPETPPADPEEEPDAPAEEPTPDEDDGPIPTPVDLRAKAQEVGTAGGRDKVKALLDKYGAKNISEFPENQRKAFMRDLDDALAALKEKA